MEKFVICFYVVGNVDFCIFNEICLLFVYDIVFVFLVILEVLKMDNVRFY